MNDDRASRILKVSDYLGVTKHFIATQSGIGPSNFNKMLDGQQTITDKTLRKIADAFPHISYDWLRTGEGEMVKENQGLMYASDVDMTSEYNKVDSDDYVPLLPVEAIAGSLSGFSQGVALRDCQKMKSPVNGADWAIQISGDSMEPEVHNGSYLFIKRMSGSFIPWGNILVIDTMDGVIVKKIFPMEGNPDYIVAKSINPAYPPFEIEKSCVLGIYRVLGGTFINSTI